MSLPANPASLHVDEMQGMLFGEGWGGRGGVATFDVDKMQGITYVVWGRGGRGGREGGGAVPFDVDEIKASNMCCLGGGGMGSSVSMLTTHQVCRGSYS